MKFKIIGEITSYEFLNTISFEQLEKTNEEKISEEIINIRFKHIKNDNENLKKKLEMLIIYSKKIKNPYIIKKDSLVKKIFSGQTNYIFIEDNTLSDKEIDNKDIKKEIFFVNSNTNKIDIENNLCLDDICINHISYNKIMKLYNKM